MITKSIVETKKRFQAAVDWYRAAYGVKKFEPAALEIGFEEVLNYDIDEVEIVIREIAKTEDEAMNMTKLIKAIKVFITRRHRVATTYVQGINARIEIDPAEAEAIRINQEQFARFKAYVAERGNKWWSDTLYNALYECNIANIHASIAKNGPECYMNWIMIKNHLKTLAGVWGRVE